MTSSKAEQRELNRRRRVVHGWAFRNISDEQATAIREYLAGGAVPPGYEKLHESVR